MSIMKLCPQKIIVIIAALAVSVVALADPLDSTPKTYYAIASTDWNSNTTWSTIGCGKAANVPAGEYPTENDSVVICVGNDVKVTADAVCGALTLTKGGAASFARLTLSDGVTVEVKRTATIGADYGGIQMASGSATLIVGADCHIGGCYATKTDLGPNGSVIVGGDLDWIAWAGAGYGQFSVQNVEVGGNCIIGNASTGAPAIILYDGAVVTIAGNFTAGGNAGGRMYMATGSGSLRVAGSTTIGHRHEVKVDMGLEGSFTTDSLLFAGTAGKVRAKDITVNSSVTVPNGQYPAEIILADGGIMNVNGDLTADGRVYMNSGSGSLTVTGITTIGDRNANMVDMGLGGSFSTDSLLFAGTRGGGAQKILPLIQVLPFLTTLMPILL